MNKYLFKLIINLLIFIIYNKNIFANIHYNNITKISNNIKQLNIKDNKKEHLQIKSNKVEINNKEIKFIGNVSIHEKNNILLADEVTLHKEQINNEKTNILNAYGNICLYNKYINMTGQKIKINLSNKNTDITLGNYQNLQQKGHGKADNIMQRNKNRYSILENGEFSFCQQKKNNWIITGSEIFYDNEKKIVDIWNAKFKIYNCPILYMPYISLPINKKSKSGFLIPKITYYNKKRIGFNLPYYFNISSCMKAKIITNYTSKKKPYVFTKILYRNKLHTNLINFKISKPNYNYTINKNPKYWFLSWKYSNLINKKHSINADYTIKNNYLSNFYTHHNNTYSKQTIQKFWYNYDNASYNLSLIFKQFEPKTDFHHNPYYTFPQINININKYNIYPYNYKLFGQITNFRSNNNYYPTTIRLHIEPTINIPLYKNNILNTEIKIRATQYQQKNSTKKHTSKALTIYNKQNTTRIIPQLTTSSELFLKTKSKKHYLPKIIKINFKHIYIPYKNQSKIAIYDSTLMPISKNNLLQEHLYSGLDRIPSTNKLINSISIHKYNKLGKELFKMSSSQIYQFSQKKTEDKLNINKKYQKKLNIMWINNSYWKINNYYSINNNIQYYVKLHVISYYETSLKYKKSKNQSIHLIYNYVNKNFIQYLQTYKNNIRYKQDISILKLEHSYQLTNNLIFSNTCSVNIKKHKITNQFTSIKYNNNCWNIFIGYEHKINLNNIKNNINKYENKILLKVEL